MGQARLSLPGRWAIEHERMKGLLRFRAAKLHCLDLELRGGGRRWPNNVDAAAMLGGRTSLI